MLRLGAIMDAMTHVKLTGGVGGAHCAQPNVC